MYIRSKYLLSKALFSFSRYSQKLILELSDSSKKSKRSWISYILFILLNFLLFSIDDIGIFLALIVDLLIGLYLNKQFADRNKILEVIELIKNGDVKAKVDDKGFHGDNIYLARAVNSIGRSIDEAVEKSIKDEKMKAKLITNVSHDLKTPLTSIINYIDLIKRENIDNPDVRKYVAVLDAKALKLKKLTEDLVEASKLSSGNVSIHNIKLDMALMTDQTIGEMYDRFEEADLKVTTRFQEKHMFICADPRHLWRVIENLFTNICKYALSNTYVYLEIRYIVVDGKRKVRLSIKNISATLLKLSGEDLTERFIRGDEARTSEGSGLGLSIAKNLTTLMGGEFEIKVEGDLFKAIITFDALEQEACI